jgi:glycosyltransferase involved in cell wall biosynthesis
MADIEVIVVGDHCTDDSAAVVAACGDDRARFVNLSRNVGDQSGPNNAGAALATAPVLAFLNHDDLWWPDHLERAVRALERTGADVVFAAATCSPGRSLTGALAAFDPREHIPASTWTLTAAAARASGPWRSAGELFAYPSQEWLFRAHRLGRRVCPSGALTVAHLSSIARPRQYIRDDVTDANAALAHIEATRKRGDGARAGDVLVDPYRGPAGLRREVRQRYEAVIAAVGVHPMTSRYLVRYGPRRGAALAHLRRLRGLEGAR